MNARPRYRRSQGFALAAVLWLMAGLSIVVVLVADAAKTSAERVAQLRERTEFIRSALSGRAQAEYWLSGARPRTADFFDGATFVMADGTPYQTDANSTIAIQDHGGLIDLNTVNSELLTNLLVGCGVPVDIFTRQGLVVRELEINAPTVQATLVATAGGSPRLTAVLGALENHPWFYDARFVDVSGGTGFKFAWRVRAEAPGLTEKGQP